MKQKIFTLSPNPAKSWSGYLSKLVALVLLVGSLGATQQAWGQTFNRDFLTIRRRVSNAVNTTTYTGKGSATPLFNGSVLASQLDLATDSLKLTAANALLRSSDYMVTAASLYYRVYIDGSAPGSYSKISLNLTSSNNQGSAITYGISGISVDLLNLPRTTGGGTYDIDIYYQLEYTDGVAAPDTDSGNATDPGNGATNPYSASFTVKAPTVTPSGSTTTWQGTIDSDWTKAGNWSNGVPNRFANAIVQERTNGSNIIYPILNDSTVTYEVRNLTLNGDLSSTKSLLTVQKATLNTYGNIRQDAGGLVGTATGRPRVYAPGSNSTLVLAGTNQTITGDLSMSDVVAAGSGIKSVTGNLIVTNTLSFLPSDVINGVLIQTAVERTVNGSTSVNFTTVSGHTVDLRATGLVYAPNGETTSSYVQGVFLANRNLVATVNQPFGNIGIELLPNHSSAASVFVKRIVNDPLFGPTSTNAGGSPVPIKRQYEITKDDDSRSVNQSNSASSVIFHYLPNANELNGIKQKNLTLFRTENNGVPYTGLGGITDTINHVVTLASLPSLDNYTLTLGDKTNPLPVSLVAFNAVRSNANTLLTWKTASELNNRGFNVQVSADGVTYRTLTFVASKSPNSSSELSYSYTDVEASKAGTRYYRLEQVDLDGTLNYSPVRAVNFDGAAPTSLALVAYPNPFSDTVGLTVEGATATTTEGTAYVKLVDMTGRTVRDQKVSLAGASLSLGDLSGLRSGLYLAKVTLPDGTVQTVRVQKQ